MHPFVNYGMFAAKIVSGLGVAKIVSDIVKNNVPVVTPLQKVTVSAGSFVLGSMLMDHSARHIEEHVEKVNRIIKDNIKIEVNKDDTPE